MLDTTTLIFIGVFIFVAFRLVSVLGTRTGEEEQHIRKEDWTVSGGATNRDDLEDSSTSADNDHSDENVVTLPNRGQAAQRLSEHAAAQRAKIISKYAEADSELAKQIDALMIEDSTFDPKEFLEGARMAYEMIVTAFADGDRRTLKNLLSNEVYDNFEQAIIDREARGEYVESSFVGVEKAKFVDVKLKNSEAQITLKLTSQLVSVTRNQDGEAIEGEAEEVAEVKDEWKFARDISSSNPNWKLIAT